MPVVPRHTQENGHSGLSAPITAAVCVVSVVVALMLCRFYMLHNAARRVVTDPGDVRCTHMEIYCLEKR